MAAWEQELAVQAWQTEAGLALSTRKNENRMTSWERQQPLLAETRSHWKHEAAVDIAEAENEDKAAAEADEQRMTAREQEVEAAQAWQIKVGKGLALSRSQNRLMSVTKAPQNQLLAETRNHWKT